MLVALALSLVATLVVPRFLDVPKSGWYAWPGYLWFGLLAYLFLTLLVARAGAACAAPLDQAVNRKRRPQLPKTSSAGAEPTDVHRADQRGGRRGRVGRPGRDRRRDRARPARPASGSGAPAPVGPGPARIPYRRGVRHPSRAIAGRAHTEQIVNTINAAEPDLVAIVGDLVDGTVEELGAAAAPLRDLSAPGGNVLRHRQPRVLRRRHRRVADRTGAARHPAAAQREHGDPARRRGVRSRRRQRHRRRAARRTARLRPRPGGGQPVASDGPARTPTGAGLRGRRARGGSAAVRPHPRRADVAVSLRRPDGAAIDCRPVDRRPTPSCTSPGARGSGARRSGSVLRRTSRCSVWSPRDH